jgi:hypothetical protein
MPDIKLVRCDAEKTGVGSSPLRSRWHLFSCLIPFAIAFADNLFFVGPIPPGLSLSQVLAFLLIAATGFVPFFVVGLGLYLIFKPMLATGSQMPVGEAQKAKPSEKENKEEIESIKQLPDEELQKELVSMKTIEHVLVPRMGSQPNKKSPVSAEMVLMLKKTRDRITAIEAELGERRQIREQDELTAVRN